MREHSGCLRNSTEASVAGAERGRQVAAEADGGREAHGGPSWPRRWLRPLLGGKAFPAPVSRGLRVTHRTPVTHTHRSTSRSLCPHPGTGRRRLLLRPGHLATQGRFSYLSPPSHQHTEPTSFLRRAQLSSSHPGLGEASSPTPHVLSQTSASAGNPTGPPSPSPPEGPSLACEPPAATPALPPCPRARPARFLSPSSRCHSREAALRPSI